MQPLQSLTVSELLQPLERTTTLTGMRQLPPFALFSSRSSTVNSKLDSHLNQWTVVAISIIGLLAVGIYMEENEVYSLYPIHQLVGFIVFFGA